MPDATPHRRSAMLASVVRETIAPVLREAPPECGIVAITEVDVSTDASFATVYISALREKDLALRFLEERRSELQRALGPALSLHRTPTLRFRFDERGERGERIEKLLGQA